MTLEELKKLASYPGATVSMPGPMLLKLLEMIAVLREGCEAGAYGDRIGSDIKLIRSVEIERSLG